jgi:hypothetical protein
LPQSRSAKIVPLKADALHDPCERLLTAQEIDRAEFEKKYQKALDQSKPQR